MNFVWPHGKDDVFFLTEGVTVMSSRLCWGGGGGGVLKVMVLVGMCCVYIERKICCA